MEWQAEMDKEGQQEDDRRLRQENRGWSRWALLSLPGYSRKSGIRTPTTLLPSHGEEQSNGMEPIAMAEEPGVGTI